MLSNFAEKKETCFDFFLYLDLVKIRLQIMLNYFEEKKETFFDLKNMNFPNSSKSHFFKGINPCFWAKKCQFFLHLDLVKIRLEIMLFDSAEKKETFFDLKKQNFSNSRKSHFFNGVNPYFWTKNAIFS